MRIYTPEDAASWEEPEAKEVESSQEYLQAFNDAVESGERPVKVKWSLFTPQPRRHGSAGTNHEDALKAARNEVICAGWKYAGKESTGFRDGSFFDVWEPDETVGEGKKGVPGEMV